VIHGSTSFRKDLSTVGTVCHKKKWMHRQWIHSRISWRDEDTGRWTFDGLYFYPLVLWLHDRKAIWYKHVVEDWLRWLGGAAPGELPGEFINTHWAETLLAFKSRLKTNCSWLATTLDFSASSHRCAPDSWHYIYKTRHWRQRQTV